MTTYKTGRFKKPFHLLLDEAHRAMLEQVSDRRAVPAAQVIRNLIDQAYRMDFANEPRCATGEGCLCPQAHYGRRPAPVSSEELLRQQKATNGPTPTNNLP